ncbi:ABC transporter ATP-binding protein [Psychroflexus sp. ALD_RP9]|uniref:ABC transporter ATP-binding protein n=1 Tax=Psychroflexus sp. ALD_RP9 TaxID=2777186 RepID=UPI001A90BD1A|nr:ATP-binding cassette domain-containing protein [Psychroflexus sp. ALD_RP9]QSS96980.1 ATP-binding cassette domain-containing protein [Psychroflexus sp. ALD_RP9]
MKTILKLNQLTKKFGKLTAVNQLSFEIEKGNVYGILGPNGSGKSTTLGIILNVVNKTSGEFEWFGGQIETHEALKKVGAIIENPNFYPNMSAEDNLKLVCKIKGVDYSKIDEKLEIVDLLDRKKNTFKSYSLGMKQRLAIASALLNDPEILILDEPTNGLDPQGIHQIREIIKTIAADGMTILLASHLLDEVEKVCSHVVIIRNGVKLYAGSVDQMNATHGFVEIASKNLDELQTALNQLEFIEKVVKHDEDHRLKAFLSQPIEASELNKTLANKGIYVNLLIKRKETLEEQFLELTKA